MLSIRPWGIVARRRLFRGRRNVLTTITCVLLFCFVFSRRVYGLIDRVRQTHPWSFQHAVASPFMPTVTEQACVLGQDPTNWPLSSHTQDEAGRKPPIPNVVHFIFGLRNPLTHPGAGTFDFLCYLAIRSAIVSVRPDEIKLHYTYLSDPPSADQKADPLSNPWIKRLAPHIKLVHHPPEEFAGHQGHWQAAHVSDVLRLELLDREGGIYLDIDAFALRSFRELLKGPRDMILGHEGGNRWGLCNAIMAARPGSVFVKRWLETYDHADLSREWNYHSVVLPKELASTSEMKDEVCTLSPGAFFWPTWTWHHVEWMHEPLRGSEVDWWSNEIRKYGGALFEGQLAYHAWNQMSYDRYLKDLTPQKVRTVHTRFNMMMRRFMEDDL